MSEGAGLVVFDAAAGQPLRREVLQQMWPWLTGAGGNPSSVHELGRAARATWDDAVERVGAALGAAGQRITITSGATEADNLAIKGIMAAQVAAGRSHVVISAVEHSAVRESVAWLGHHGVEVSICPVDAAGHLRQDVLADLVTEHTGLVSVGLASAEIGTVQQVPQIAAIAHARGAVVHTDAVQAVGSVPVRFDELGVDALTLSAHKLGGPVGAGALITRWSTPIEAQLHGGGQQDGLRAGTQDVAAAIGLAAAVELAVAEQAAQPIGQSSALRDRLIDEVGRLVPQAMLTGDPGIHRLPRHLSWCVPGVSGESLLVDLEARGFLCSSGSACAAGRDEPSPTLLALGIDAQTALGALRVTLPREATVAQADGFARALAEVLSCRVR